MPHCTGFPPIATRTSRLLILGSLPGAESLRQRRYYANPNNSFWKIMHALIGAGPDLPYTESVRRLKQHHIALWDVCATATREGSLDSAIDPATIAANDFPAFFKTHPHIRLIAFNGQTAAKLFQRLVPINTIPQITLPSTSPAHAGMRFEEKLSRWREALAECRDAIAN